MAIENEVTEDSELDYDGADDDFASGVTQQEPTVTATPDTPEAGTTEPEPTPEPEPPAPKPANITEQDWAELQSKATAIDEIKAESQRKFDTLAGNLGGMKQLIEQLRQRGGVKLSPGQLKRTAAEFPELEAMLTEDLNEVLSAPNQAAIDPEEIDKRARALMDAELPKVVAAMEKKILRSYHRDWVDVVRSKEFQDWEATLPQAERDQLKTSTDGEYIADKITEFKEAAKAKAKAAADAAAKQPRSNARQARIESAVAPRGTGGHAEAPSEDDDYLAGVRSG